MKNVFICDAVRTPHGSFYGAHKDRSSSELGALAVKALLARIKIPAEHIDGVFMGEVLTAGEGQNPARHAALKAGLPESCEAETFNKVCASSLAALRHATHLIELNRARAMIVGGMENMSRAPYLVPRYKKMAGDATVMSLAMTCEMHAALMAAHDSMMYDGLTEPSSDGRPHMGAIAEECARMFNISREEQEAYAYESFARTHAAYKAIYIQPLLVSVSGMAQDECLRVVDREKMERLKPVFAKNGTITAATSSQIADGASALLIADEAAMDVFGIRPLARIVGFAVHSQDPKRFTTAPVGAIKRLIDSNRLMIKDVDLFEINEAFAVVPICAMQEHAIPHEKMNVWGGSIAIGHPLGATGTRIVGQLAYQLHVLNKRCGIAVACNGGGEAVAVLLERV